ncbi:CzcE family metal-binding protein [Massilia sp. LXY-6]|uniref:CzcE family metal-binding protein n=1 Tax=Massilia sp. LXY-6 TaxID=3379823 RepID=UPI003EE10704
MNILSLAATAATLATLTACSTPASAAPRADLLGMAAPPSAATQTVAITPATRWVNVTSGDTVRFVVDGREFAWNFSVGPTVAVFDLNRVAPPGLLGRALPVYVDPDPYYSIGADWRIPAH